MGLIAGLTTGITVGAIAVFITQDLTNSLYIVLGLPCVCGVLGKGSGKLAEVLKGKKFFVREMKAGIGFCFIAYIMILLLFALKDFAVWTSILRDVDIWIRIWNLLKIIMAVFGGLLLSLFVGVNVGWITGGSALIASLISDRIVFPLTRSLFAFLRFRTIICESCLRYTSPPQSRYDTGRRYCEHCDEEVEDTKEPGKVILTFGNLSLDPEGRVFVLSDPEFEQKEQPIDVSEVYIDTKTCNTRLFERFITYILHFRPKYGLHSVKIFYKGELEGLGQNLKNTLHNNFTRIEKSVDLSDVDGRKVSI
jgi:hypothetical protein